MRGDTVIVRAYGGTALVRRVWDAEGDTVYICSDKNFDWLSRNDGSGTCIGFPTEDVFIFTDSVPLIEPVPWHKLEQYAATARS